MQTEAIECQNDTTDAFLRLSCLRGCKLAASSLLDLDEEVRHVLPNNTACLKSTIQIALTISL